MPATEPRGEGIVRMDLDDVRVLASGELDAATAALVVETACVAAVAAEAGGSDKLEALEVLEQCSQTEAGAEALTHSQLGCEVLLTAAVRSPKQSMHQLSAVAALANVAAASSEARLTMVRMGATEVLLSLTSDPELMCTEHQRPTLLALQNLACEACILPGMAQAGVLDVAVMLLAAPAFAESDLCIHMLNVILAYTVAGREALDLLVAHRVPISLVHFFMTYKPPQPSFNGGSNGDPCTPPRQDESTDQELVYEVWHSTQTVTLQIFCNMVNDSSTAQTHLFSCGLPGLVLTVLSSDRRPNEHQLWAMRILAPCAQESDIQAQLASSDAVDILLDYAARESVQGSEAQVLALDTLALLSSDAVATQLILAKGLPALEALLLLPQLQGSRQQLSVVEIIGWMSSKGAAERLQLNSSGIPAAILSLLSKADLAGHPIVGAALVFLNNLSLEEEARLHMVEMGIFMALANIVIFDCPGADSQQKALGIISALATQEQPEIQVALLKSGVIQSVNAVLEHYSSGEEPPSLRASEIVRLALEVQVNLSAAAGQTAEVMVQHGAVEALMTVASNQIENRDPNTIENHQLYAIKALKNLSCEPAVAPVLRSKGAQDWLESMEREKPEVMAQLDGALAAMTLAESS